MNYYVLVNLINGSVSILFGLFVFLKDRKNSTNRNFFLMGVGVSLWSFAYARWMIAGTESDALFWSKVLNLGATIIPIFYLHCVLSILNIVKEKKKILFFGYSITILFCLFSFTPLYITSVKQVLSFPYWPQAGPLYVLFLIFGYFGLTGYGVYELLKARKNADIEKNHQINYLVLGTVFGFLGGAFNFPFMFGFGIFPLVLILGQIAVVLFYYFSGMAAIKYHLFNIRLLLTELLVEIMGIILLILPFVMPTEDLKVLTITIFILFLVFGYYLVKATREEIERKEEAERISKLKTEFISIASHQLRTPLAAIRGYASMLKDGDYGEFPDQAEVAVDYIYEASVNMIKLVNSLLSVSRLEKGQIELKMQDVSVDSLLEECIKDIEILAKDKGLYIKYKKSRAKLPSIKGDPEKIKQALNNLINNAVHYTLKGGVTIETKKMPANILIQITDTGVGLDKEDFSKIFKSFSRGKGASEIYTQGTGLGLYVARNFIEMHNGKIWADSDGKNKGSTFYIELPIKTELQPRQDFVLADNLK
ncbi:MAG: ATP-binding protein [Candidatus Pacebacteria bacterium]|nr:ATP-binding protein [Candidatus Paceibacterota bacterium]